MTHEQRIAEIRALSDRVTKHKLKGITEQGRSGLLWTLFEGDVGGRRVCSVAGRDDALLIQSLYEHREELLTLAAECLRLMEPERFTLVLAVMFRKETVFFQMAGYDCFPVDALTRTEGKFMVRSTMGNWYECKNLNDLHSQSLDAAKEVR